MTGFRFAVVFVAAVLAIAWPANASTDTSVPKDAVARMLERIDALSALGGLSDGEIARRFRMIAADHMDRSSMAAAALGSMAYKLTVTDWQHYAAAFDVHMGLGFVRGVREYGASLSKVLGERRTPAGKTVVIARVRSSAREQDMVFYMCDRAPALVCDVEVNGVRASGRQQAAFLRVLGEGGLDGLVEALEAGQLVEVQ